MDSFLYIIIGIAIFAVGLSALNHIVKAFEGSTKGNSFWFLIAVIAFIWACLAYTDFF